MGEVKNLAEVSVNGKALGILWKTPYRVEVTGTLKPGANKVEIKVTNPWVNRIIGDRQPNTAKTPQLLAKIPVGTFIDHGVNREPGDRETKQSWENYQKLVSSHSVKRSIAKVGDILPIEGLRAEIVSADGCYSRSLCLAWARKIPHATRPNNGRRIKRKTRAR